MNKNKPVIGLLGIAMKAGKVVSGEEGTLKSIKGGKVYLTLIAGDSSENTKKKFADKCNYRGVPYRTVMTKGQLGDAIGKETRAVVGILDPNLAKRMIELIDPSH